MAGKEYRARDRTVQKMSRDGLVEENKRTGKSRRAVTADPENIRIGERPTARPEKEDILRARTDTDADAVPTRRKSKIRMEQRESSIVEAPSSLGNAGRGVAESPISNMEEKEGTGSARARLRNRRAVSIREADDIQLNDAGRQRLTRKTDIRSDGERQEEEGTLQDTEVSGSTNSRSRQKLRQRRSALESEPAAKKENPENGVSEKTKRLLMNRQAADDAELTGEEPAEETVSKQSKRMQQIRGHPSGVTGQAARSAAEIRRARTKKQVYDYEASERRKKSRLQETVPEAEGLEDAKDEIKSKQKKERLNQEQRKAKGTSRLNFDDGNGMVRGNGAGFKGRAKRAVTDTAATGAKSAAGAATFAAHAKLSDVEDENIGAKAAHHTEMVAADSVRAMSSRRVRSQSRKAKATRRKAEEAGVNRLVFAKEEGTRTAKAAKIEADKKTTIKKFFQKQRQRRLYAQAKKEEKTVETLIKTQQNLVAKAAVVVKEAFVRNSKVFLIIGLMGVFFLLISASLTSCTALMQGAGSSVVGTTYPSTDEDIYAVENRYRELEAALNAQINQMKSAHPEYDDFRYQIDEISHNPYHLISYFTTKYGEFTYDQVKDELEEIFREQYGLTTSGERNVTVTETKKVRVGDSLGQVVTSGYCNCPICCGQWSGGPTASGVYPTAAHTIAVDASNPFVPMGTHVIMNGVEYVVEDTGNFARYGVQFDVYYDDHQTAQNHGHQTWEAYLADDNGAQEIEVTTTQTVNRYSVSLTNHNLDTVLRNRLTDEEKVRYSLYNRTYGHRDYLFDLNSLPTYGGSGYTIPPEALSDERFARMIGEAEKHLGTPYVWGGYAPGGFDCSGFVSWVINHCGNGWNYGRLTAEGIRQVCAYVSPADAKPGDIIFFERTYDTAGASHVGIYVGNGMMIHCGKPVQYTSINTDYWNNHFLQFGRLP